MLCNKFQVIYLQLAFLSHKTLTEHHFNTKLFTHFHLKLWLKHSKSADDMVLTFLLMTFQIKKQGH